MDIFLYMLWAVSIAATLFSIVMVVVLVLAVITTRRLMTILDKLEAMSDAGLEASRTLHAFVEKTTLNVSSFMQAFLTLKGAKEVAGHISDALHKVKKGVKDGQ